MQKSIKENIENPSRLEMLYRSDRKGFEKAFFEIYREISDHKIAEFWKTRLEFGREKESSSKIRKEDILVLVVSCILTGILIKIPQLLGHEANEYFFYLRNGGMIALFGLSLYATVTKDLINYKQVIIAFSIFLISAIYINLLPSSRESQSFNLSCIHLPLMLWCLYGMIFIDFDNTDKNRRIAYIRYNGELVVLGAIILIAGAILTMVTLGLFSVIDLTIGQFYLNYIVVWGLVSAPIVATFIIRKYPFVANRIAPIIADIFSPLVLVSLVIYMVSILFSGKNPYNDREFLIVFNIMLLGVMGIVVFSISEAPAGKRSRVREITLFALSVITIIVDLVALSAILYRLGHYGFTPNRTAVLGSNLLIFINLLLIMIDLYGVVFKNKDIKRVETTIARYLPVYAAWTVIVIFVMPWIFRLK